MLCSTVEETCPPEEPSPLRGRGALLGTEFICCPQNTQTRFESWRHAVPRTSHPIERPKIESRSINRTIEETQQEILVEV
jgi:hypothetical protein